MNATFDRPGPWLPLIAVASLALLAACASAAAPTASPTTNPPEPTHAPTPTSGPIIVNVRLVPDVDLTQHSVPLGEVVFNIFGGELVRLDEAPPLLAEAMRDAIPPIYNPGYGGLSDLTWLVDNELVIGYESTGGTYAYPLGILKSRELVNDFIDGVPVLISYCPLCVSGVVYDRRVDGETLIFGNTSALHESDLVMFDHGTGSYWLQVVGEGIVGGMTGKRLTPLPSMTVEWGFWKRLHPDTQLLVSDRGAPLSGAATVPIWDVLYQQTLNKGEFPFPVSQNAKDSRLRPGDVVLTVEVGSSARAYPVLALGHSAANDTLGGKPVVVFSRGNTGSALLSTVSGQTLTFEIGGGERFVDGETGSTWNFAGHAVEGPLEGARLDPLPSRRSFWFSIAAASPGIDLYEP